MVLLAGSKGVDVSHHQNFNAKKFKEMYDAGIRFVVIRASHGFNKDRKFEQHYKAAREAGLYVGAYAYYYYKDEADSKRETETFLNAIKDKRFDLPCFVDFENRGEFVRGRHLGALPYTSITDRAIAALETIKAAGYWVGIYCDVNWAKTKMQMERIPEYVLLWLADWAEKLDFDPDGRCVIRQYTDNLSEFPGVDGNKLLKPLTVEALGGAFGVIVNCVFWCNRRMGPSTNTEKMGTAKRGLDIFINGKRTVKGELWFHDSNGTWIHSKFVQTNPDEIPFM